MPEHTAPPPEEDPEEGDKNIPAPGSPEEELLFLEIERHPDNKELAERRYPGTRTGLRAMRDRVNRERAEQGKPPIEPEEDPIGEIRQVYWNAKKTGEIPPKPPEDNPDSDE